MYLKPNTEAALISDLKSQLPELLKIAGINISQASQDQLLAMMTGHIHFRFYASETEEAIKAGMAMLLPPLSWFFAAMYMATAPYAVFIDSKCSNPELANLSKDQKNLLDTLIYNRVMLKYRDTAKEAQIAADAAAKRAKPRP